MQEHSSECSFVFLYIEHTVSTFRRFTLAGRRYIFDDFEIETERTEAVVATDHSTHGIAHPAIVEVAFSLCERLRKRTNSLPCRRAETIGALGVGGYPLLPLPDVTGMFDGILVLSHQIVIDSLTNGSNANFVHGLDFCILCFGCKGTKNF